MKTIGGICLKTKSFSIIFNQFVRETVILSKTDYCANALLSPPPAEDDWCFTVFLSVVSFDPLAANKVALGKE